MARAQLVPLLLPADPTVALHAAPKQYVDALPRLVMQSYQQQVSGLLFGADVSGASEEVASNLQFNLALTSGRTYRIGFGGSLTGSIANENWAVNVNVWQNRNTAVTASDLGTAIRVLSQRARTAVGLGNAFYAEAFYTATATNTHRFAISMIRSAGSGSANIAGDNAAGGMYPIPFFVEEVVAGTPPAGTTIGINDLSDVDTATSAPTNGQMLAWNSGSALWLPRTPWTVSTTAPSSPAVNDIWIDTT